MSKRLEKMRAAPKADWTIADIEAVCRETGVQCLPSKGGSSHYKVWHSSQVEILTVPFKRPIKAVYIRRLIQFIDAGGLPMTLLEYPVMLEPLTAEDGGGFAAIVPDLPGCMSDGETPEEAIANVRDAISTWIEAATALGRSIPTPSRHLKIA